MRIVAVYSFKDGQRLMEKRCPRELEEIRQVTESVDAVEHKHKVSEEKTSPGVIFYSPVGMNSAFQNAFYRLGWETVRVPCDYPTEYYVEGYTPPISLGRGAFREMDFVKNRVGIEVQFGKYAFMVYNVAAKMTIFHNPGYIDIGVEIVPVKELQNEMSTGVSYFEQFIWDLEQRGSADIDIPVLVLGVTK